MNPEKIRLAEEESRQANWKRWGPYLSERQWGTVREDYSSHGNAWAAFPHDHARKKAYRWGEDGLQGWSDRQCRLCFAPVVWNEEDTILKERLFGLAGNEGNHGEDVKECYYYLDSTPTHSYTKALYKYPQARFPYTRIRLENDKLGRSGNELELADMGMFEESNYFDITQEVAKRSAEDIMWRIVVKNQSSEAAPIHLLPSLWFRNTWSWGDTMESPSIKPSITQEGNSLLIEHESLGKFRFYCGDANTPDEPQDWLFTENETNYTGLENRKNESLYTKDAFHRYIINGEKRAVSKRKKGTKAAAHIKRMVPAGESLTIICRLHRIGEDNGEVFLNGHEGLFAARIREADEFYQNIIPHEISDEERMICRQGYAGLLWTKQFFYYSVDEWLKGDPKSPPPPANRLQGRNHDWRHFHAKNILSMPDKWEYPWFAAWDTAFHMLPFCAVDSAFTKDQLLLLLREWYMHPNGQLPAYEWNFSDVNPPVHAWAVWRVYKIADQKGERDILFLEKAFQKLLLNFTWWVNRKDRDGRHVFGGGFLGLDNIGVFDRSHALPGGGYLQQADGTAWMGFYCLTMLSIAMELAQTKPAYEDIASKFLEHFVNISQGINSLGGSGLWDTQDRFYYDQLIIDNEAPIPLRIRSLVGLLPLCAVTVLKQKTIDSLPGFKKRMDWFLTHKPDVLRYVTATRVPGKKSSGRVLLAIPSKERLRESLTYMFDSEEFLSNFGIRSLSKAHDKSPFVFHHGGATHTVEYTPGEAMTDMFGGNSNWRGPIWFPTNFILIEALERYYYFYGDDFKMEFPTGSGVKMTLREIALNICDRLISLFKKNEEGYRPCFGDTEVSKRYSDKADWQNLLLFHEYFHAETGEGLGASHQTGWTALVVRLVRERREKLLNA